MKIYSVPIIKVGTPYQRPSWRYDALLNPLKYGLSELLSRSEDSVNPGFAKRLINRGEVRPSSVFTIPDYFRRIQTKLPKNLADRLERVWTSHYYKTHKRKINFNLNKNSIPFSWNHTKVKNFRDPYFQKLVLHFFNYEYHDDIEFAVRFWKSAENSEIKRYFGYSFYARLSDKTIAHRWNITIPQVKAIRHLFFDFSHFPKDRITAWALMRQLAEMQEIDAEDFARYKKVYDLGELGIKMIEDYYRLTAEEKIECEKFLGASAVVNTIQLNVSIRDAKDALNYNSVIGNFAKLSILREELRQKEATLRLTELNIMKASKDLNISIDKVQEEDLHLLEAMKELSKYDHEPKFTKFADLLALNKS